MEQEKWDKLHKELDDALETAFEPKHETIEEAAEKAYQKGLQDDIDLSFYDGVRLGAKWQTEKMYSEEDLREAFRQGESNVGYNSKYGYTLKLTEKEWFEQFKKK
jgi:hypothetical protein